MTPFLALLTLGRGLWHSGGDGTDRSGSDCGGATRRRRQLRAVGAKVFSPGFCHGAPLRPARERGRGHRAGGLDEGLSEAPGLSRRSALRALVDAPDGPDLLRFSAGSSAQPGSLLFRVVRGRERLLERFAKEPVGNPEDAEAARQLVERFLVLLSPPARLVITLLEIGWSVNSRTERLVLIAC